VQSQHIVKNRILRQLSADELKSVQPWLTPVELRSSVVLHEPGDPIEQVYFPVSGMISLLAVMQTGEAIETGIVGADGLLGGDAAINGHAFGQMTVQMDGAALRMPKAQFVEAYLKHPHLRNLVDRYQAYDASAAECGLPRPPFSPQSALPLAPTIPGHGRKRHVQPDPGISFPHARRAKKYGFGRSPCRAGSRADPVQARTYHYPQP